MVLEEKPDRYDHQKNNATVSLVVFKMTSGLASNVKVAGWVGQGEGVKIGKNWIFHLSYLLPLASSPSLMTPACLFSWHWENIIKVRELFFFLESASEFCLLFFQVSSPFLPTPSHVFPCLVPPPNFSLHSTKVCQLLVSAEFLCM